MSFGSHLDILDMCSVLGCSDNEHARDKALPHIHQYLKFEIVHSKECADLLVMCTCTSSIATGKTSFTGAHE